MVYVEGKARMVEFINDTWFRTGWSVDIKSFYTNANQKITRPEPFGLGTKEAPILSEEDQKHLQGVPSIEETHNGQEEGPSTRRGGFLDQEVIDQLLEAGDQAVGSAQDDDELSNLIGKVEMTTTKTMTEIAQRTTKAYLKGGEPVEENPMRPSSAIASEVRTLQGQNLYGQGNMMRTDSTRPAPRAFGNRSSGGGPPRGGPPGRAPRRDPLRGSPPGGNSPQGGSPARRDLDDDDCQRDQIHTGKISSHIDIFDRDRAKAKKIPNGIWPGANDQSEPPEYEGPNATGSPCTQLHQRRRRGRMVSWVC